MNQVMKVFCFEQCHRMTACVIDVAAYSPGNLWSWLMSSRCIRPVNNIKSRTKKRLSRPRHFPQSTECHFPFVRQLGIAWISYKASLHTPNKEQVQLGTRLTFLCELIAGWNPLHIGDYAGEIAQILQGGVVKDSSGPGKLRRPNQTLMRDSLRLIGHF